MRVRRLEITVRAAFAVAIVAVFLPTSARADTTVPITGIGTQVSDLFAINTHVDSVTYSDPQVVEIAGFGKAVEIRGTVSGVGWGGGGIVARANNAHYNYQIPFVARWRVHGASKDLVMFHHGGDQTPIILVLQEKLRGPQDPHRRAELDGDLAHGLPALLNHCTYVSANRRGLRGDGTFSATYLTSEVPPLTQAEVNALNATIASGPGTPGFRQPGIEAGAPVPLAPRNDAPTFRDIDQALQQVLGDLMGKPFRIRIFSGNSSGARLGAAIDFGRNAILSQSVFQSVRTGGNQTVPYDRSKPTIFDGFILGGFGYDSAAERADAALPISAPVFFLQGRGDERYQHPIRMAHELLMKGVPLNDLVWIYEIKNMNHIARDSGGAVAPTDGDALGCYVSAAIRNMGELLREGIEPPVSQIAGRILDGGLVFDVADGAVTNVMPIREDPLIDSVEVGPMLTLRQVDIGVDAGATARWQAVTAVLTHENDAIIGPSIACRLGGYRIKFFANELLPFSQAQLAAIYGTLNGYRERVDDVVAGLEALRLYDPRVESAMATAERARGLFAY